MNIAWQIFWAVYIVIGIIIATAFISSTNSYMRDKYTIFTLIICSIISFALGIIVWPVLVGMKIYQQYE